MAKINIVYVLSCTIFNNDVVFVFIQGVGIITEVESCLVFSGLSFHHLAIQQNEDIIWSTRKNETTTHGRI